MEADDEDELADDGEELDEPVSFSNDPVISTFSPTCELSFELSAESLYVVPAELELVPLVPVAVELLAPLPCVALVRMKDPPLMLELALADSLALLDDESRCRHPVTVTDLALELDG